MGTYLLTGFFKEINHSPYRQIVKKVCRMLTINYVFCVSTVFDLACDVFFLDYVMLYVRDVIS